MLGARIHREETHGKRCSRQGASRHRTVADRLRCRTGRYRHRVERWNASRARSRPAPRTEGRSWEWRAGAVVGLRRGRGRGPGDLALAIRASAAVSNSASARTRTRTPVDPRQNGVARGRVPEEAGESSRAHVRRKGRPGIRLPVRAETVRREKRGRRGAMGDGRWGEASVLCEREDAGARRLLPLRWATSHNDHHDRDDIA